MNKSAFIAIAAFLFLCFPVFAQTECERQNVPEGFKCIEGNKGVTVFNEEQMNAVFASYEESEGALALKQGRNKIAYINGTIALENAAEKQIRIVKGGFYPAERALFNATIYGEAFVVSAKEYPVLKFALVSAFYRQHDYTLMCEKGAQTRTRYWTEAVDDNSCALKATVSPERAYANISGVGVIVHNSEVKPYIGGEEIDSKFLTKIYDMNGVEVLGTSNLSLIAQAIINSRFSTVVIKSAEEIKLNRTQKEGQDVIYIEADKADILSNGESLILIPKNPQSSILNLWKGGEKVLEIKGGPIFLTSDNKLYEECAGREIYEGIRRREAAKMHCGLFNKAESRIAFQPKFVKRGEDILPFELTLFLPAIHPYNKLEITGFNPNVPGANINVVKAGVPGEMNFEVSNITITESNWFDFGISFLSLIYVPETQSYPTYSCDLATKTCYYDGSQVMGPPVASLPVRCETSRECGEGRECLADEFGEKFCIRARQCELIEGLAQGETQNPINVLFVSDLYGSEEEFEADILKVADSDKTHEGLLGIMPFSKTAYATNFRFYKLYTGRYARPRTELAFMQCPEADIRVSFSAQNFVSYADFGAILFSTPQIDGASKSRVFVHEFAHAFGDVKDEYMQGGEDDESNFIDLDAGDPNCVDYTRAKELWGNELADEAKSNGWYGCGGYCDRACRRTYLRPSENSIMGDHKKADGGTFNAPTEKWLDDILAKWALEGPIII